ncbi:MAG: hypothetical protein QM760_05170 [Nibricoccus sp.]
MPIPPLRSFLCLATSLFVFAGCQSSSPPKEEFVFTKLDKPRPPIRTLVVIQSFEYQGWKGKNQTDLVTFVEVETGIKRQVRVLTEPYVERRKAEGKKATYVEHADPSIDRAARDKAYIRLFDDAFKLID